MTLSILDLPPAEFMTSRDKLAADMRAVSRFGMGASFSGRDRRDHPVMDHPLWKELPVLRALRELAWQQLGSSGGGNHFFDAMIGEVIAEADWLPLKPGDSFVAVMTHSGSRKTGATLAEHYSKLARQETERIARGIPKDYEWLSIDADPGREYLAVMNLMGSYAEANHSSSTTGFSTAAVSAHACATRTITILGGCCPMVWSSTARAPRRPEKDKLGLFRVPPEPQATWLKGWAIRQVGSPPATAPAGRTVELWPRNNTTRLSSDSGWPSTISCISGWLRMKPYWRIRISNT